VLIDLQLVHTTDPHCAQWMNRLCTFSAPFGVSLCTPGECLFGSVHNMFLSLFQCTPGMYENTVHQ
jgi:hypothetical protein